jgi:hypothetical protein
MAWMRRAMTYVMVWSGATTLAVLLVWFGARPVLHNAVFGEPPAQRLTGPSAGRSPTQSAAPPADSSTVAVPRRSPSPSPAARDRTYLVRGGRVVLSVTATAARLVSAIPNPGYAVQTWRGDRWLRVDFTRGDSASSVVVAWNGHPPTVQFVN